ncbi:hypothetical protein B4N89_46935 [Embleya scabrispora]|uniref:Uncharacterized protein n=1 Tax=Embleya scabrispora TaxID=159449 RepID=A0A1T3NIP4_9ACTN|nr:hypothetical protein B4N89_46935 [Embleya scabrispora]
MADAAGGIHSAGSRSALLWLTLSWTAARDRSSSRSLAYRSRVFASQPAASTGGGSHSEHPISEGFSVGEP